VGGLTLLAAGHGLGMREPELSVPLLVTGALVVGWVVPLTGGPSRAAGQDAASESVMPMPTPVQPMPPVRYWLMPVWIAAVILLVFFGALLGAFIVFNLRWNH
jgi:hypothetical protein